MSDKIEQGIKLFGFIDSKLRDSISAFLVGGVLVGSILSLYVYSRIDNEIELKEEYKQRNTELTHERDFLRDKIIQADEDCTNRVMFFNSMIQDLKQNTAQTKAKTAVLADKQKETIKQVSEIKDKVKQKVK